MSQSAPALVATAGIAPGGWVFMLGLILGVVLLVAVAASAAAPAPPTRDLDADGPVARFKDRESESSRGPGE